MVVITNGPVYMFERGGRGRGGCSLARTISVVIRYTQKGGDRCVQYSINRYTQKPPSQLCQKISGHVTVSTLLW